MNKKLFALLTSWLLIISLLAGCVFTPVETPDLSKPTTPSGSSSQQITSPSTVPSTTPTTAPAQPSTAPTQPTTPPATQPGTQLPEGSSFAVHFIDVGQADAILVLCDGKNMLIDGGNKADSNLMYTYLKKHNITHLDYVIGTHAHEDHVGGIPGALQVATVDKVYSPTTSHTTQAFKNFANAVKNRGAKIEVPTIGMTFNLGSAVCTVLAVNSDKSDLNETSIVLRVVYGENVFLFTGDAGRETEQILLNKGVDLKADVLKVGHHGSNTSTTYPFLREVMPEYAVICVGTGNTYGHPTENTLSRLRDAEVKTFRTDKQGDIICVSDGKNITFTVSRNADMDMYKKIGPNSTQKSE